MKKLKIGYIALSKASWMTPSISAIVEQTAHELAKLDCELIHRGVTTTEAEGVAVADEFARAGIDGCILHTATFPVGAIIPAVAQRLDVPFILLANPEDPGAGGMWHQNSFCGANMAAHAMKRLGRSYCYRMSDAAGVCDALAEPLAALRAIANLRELRLGLAGGRVPGFYTSNFDELGLRRKLGVTVEVIELLEVFSKAEHLSTSAFAAARETVNQSSRKRDGVSEADLDAAARLFGAFLATAEQYRLSGFAVRCWPEFSDLFGIAPCAVLGLLSNAGLGASCEGDVTGAVTMKLLEFLAGQPDAIAFFVDLISCDPATESGVVWHCGAAPSKLCRDFEETVYRRHMRVDGGDRKGVTNDFPLKPGRITLAKLDTDENGGWRMLIAPGEALDTAGFLRGNPLRIRFDDGARELVETVMREGFEHHYAVIHADIANALKLFCDWTGIKAVTVKQQ